MLYSHRNSTGMNGSATSCSVAAMAAATILLRVSHAKKMERSVFSPTSGVNPKKIPMATPLAMAFGVSRIASSLSECSLNHLRRFIGSRNPVQSYQTVHARSTRSRMHSGFVQKYLPILAGAPPHQIELPALTQQVGDSSH